jgi:hypothetical protein
VSRTDKTRPFWVKQVEYTTCFPRTKDDWPRTYRAYEWWRGEFRCCCKMCGYDAFGTPLRKRRRAEGKRIVRNWWREY